MNSVRRLGIVLLLAGSTSVALACGICIEDKVAVVYDYAVVERALGAQHHVAFCGVEGGFVSSDGLKREIERAIESTSGVDHGSARVSLDNASASFAFDPARAQLGTVLRETDRKLAARGLRLVPLRVMDRPAELKAVGQRP